MRFVATIKAELADEKERLRALRQDIRLLHEAESKSIRAVNSLADELQAAEVVEAKPPTE